MAKFKKWLGPFIVADTITWLVISTIMLSIVFFTDIIAIGVMFGTIVVVGGFLLIFPFVPGLVNVLSNDTSDSDQKEPHTFAFFTFLEPGRVKSIVRGQRFIRAIMRYDEHCFKGASESKGNRTIRGEVQRIPPNTSKYWEVIRTPQGEDDSHPIPVAQRRSILDVVWWWSRYVYRFTGAVFTGIPPFQTVRVYKLERFVKKTIERAGYDFVPLIDFSDHARVSFFQFFVRIKGAETVDQAPLEIDLAVTALAVNPYDLFFETDNWSTQLATLLVDTITNHVRGLSRAEVIAENRESEGAIEKRLRAAVMTKEVKKKLKVFGLVISQADVMSIEVTDPELKKSLAEMAAAVGKATAAVTLSEGEATAITNVGNAEAGVLQTKTEIVRNGGVAAHAVLDQTALVAAAKETGRSGGTTLLSATGTKPVDPAIALLQQTIGGKDA